jgi:hypothetical protein
VETVPCDPTPVTSADGIATPVTATIEILTPNTNYIYRVRAQNSGGAMQLGDSEPFSTLPNAPVVSAEAATGVGTAAAALVGAVDNKGAAAGSACVFEWGPSVAYGTTAPCQPSPVTGSGPVAVTSPQLSGLSPATTYHFRVVATNAGGTTTGTDRTFTTAALPEVPTLVPPAGEDPPPPAANPNKAARQRIVRAFRSCRNTARKAFRQANRRAGKRLEGPARAKAKRVAAKRRGNAISRCQNRMRNQQSRINRQGRASR